MEPIHANPEQRRKLVHYILQFDKNQLFEIDLGRMYGLSLDQINIYARPEFNYLIMQLIRDCIVAKIDIEKVKFLADTKFDYSRMIIIKNGFDNGLSIDQVEQYADPAMNYNESVRIMNELINKS